MSNRRDNVEKTYGHTCEWLLRCSEWLTWRQGPSQLLWIKGNPGAGKSTMMKYAIKNVQRLPDEKVVSHFFNARGGDLEQSAEGLCQALLVQLLRHITPDGFNTSEGLLSASEESSDKIWPLPRLLELLEEVILLLRATPITIFVDAVDECKEYQLQAMVDSLCEILEEAGPDSQLRICFASRYFPHVTRDGATELLLENHAEHYTDVRRYIVGQLRSSKMITEAQFSKHLQTRAAGSFIWAFLVIRILKSEYRKGVVTNWEARLEALPETLEDLYRTILDRNRNESREETLMCYKWILVAQRNLDLRQLWWAIRLSCTQAISDASIVNEFKAMSIHDIERRILDISRGFVAASGEDSPVQFIHETAREFAIRETDLKSAKTIAETNETFKKCCHRALVATFNLRPAPNFFQGLPGEYDYSASPTREELQLELPFARYASEEILHHADEAQDGDIDQSAFLSQLWRIKASVGRVCFLLGSKTSKHYGASSIITLLMANDRTNLIYKCRSLLVDASRKRCFGLDIDSGSYAAISIAIEERCILAIGALMALHVKRRTAHTEFSNFLGQLGETACESLWISGTSVESKMELTKYPDALFDLADFHNESATFFLISTIPADSPLVAPDLLPELLQKAHKGFEPALEFLLKEGLSPESSAFSFAGVCCWAAARGHVSLIRHCAWIVPNILRSSHTLVEKRSALDLAASNGQLKMVQYLSKKRGDRGKPSRFAIEQVAGRPYPYDEIAKLLWEFEKF